MRTYDIEKLFEYCTECADQCAEDNGPLDMGIPCVVATFNDDDTSVKYYDEKGDYFFTLTHRACAKGLYRDVCIKSIQKKESSQLTEAQVIEVLEFMFKSWDAAHPGHKIIASDCVLLEISYTVNTKRFTETVLATFDWFDNFCYDAWKIEALQ